MNRRGERGSSLVMNLVAVAAFSILGSLVVVAARSGVRVSANYARQSQAHAIAEAGFEDALHALYQDPTWRTGFSQKPFAGGRYTVTVTSGSAPVISATGYAPGLLTTAVKTISARAVFVSSEAPKNAIFANQLVVNGTVDAYDPAVTLTPSATDFVSGALIVSNAGVDTSGAACPSPRILGEITYFSSPAPQAACVSGTITHSTYTVPLPSTGCGPCRTINNNASGINPPGAYNSGAKKLTVSAGTTVTLSPGTYYFSFVTFQGNGILVADTSSGTVRVFYDNKLQETTTCRWENTSKIPSRLLLADIDNSNKVDLECPGPLYAYLEGSTNHFELKPGVELYGHISADRVTVNAGSKLHYDIGSGTSYNHVTWTVNSADAWSESYLRQ